MNELNVIVKEMQGVIEKIGEEEIERFDSELQNTTRIFVAGEGRSGFMAKAFAMRLMHLGYNVFVIGETVTPSVAEGDCLIAISGSGSTQSVIHQAERSRSAGSKVVCITANGDSALAQVADTCFVLPAATKKRGENEAKSIQPLSSLFDQCLHVFCDAVCLRSSTQKTLSHEEVLSRHSNTE
ncbi:MULTISPECIES: 6-phospho-3-hexuloisomerase [Fictibacillus]|uniref:6-phospho 3-hexuloisomerase n=1 Tax=Fictibacillus enclensis TaxID=1017270 RepID=A0A0V8J9I7_9BACL|nr:MULTISPECIES: 6-phospho-3-hexuloisomerase [Fictibacillus]KSU83847.1 6-phospho 3-hexuloisomerase [Fictibacillus enclensis]MDM5199868.1 6-phospho-3-hexuloisomerase [Fictibacillus enclensis]RXY98359.1 6-phospho-3-hexuloisomerase [Fictibacillus sp. S7]SCC22022.1 6-phospho-3-hexuloisomerase [Fictibacillus enclensis]